MIAYYQSEVGIEKRNLLYSTLISPNQKVKITQE